MHTLSATTVSKMSNLSRAIDDFMMDVQDDREFTASHLIGILSKCFEYKHLSHTHYGLNLANHLDDTDPQHYGAMIEGRRTARYNSEDAHEAATNMLAAMLA